MIVEYSGNGLKLQAYGTTISFESGKMYDVEEVLYAVLISNFPAVFRTAQQNGKPILLVRKPASVTDAMTKRNVPAVLETITPPAPAPEPVAAILSGKAKKKK
jgi:hypothetical protein